MNKKTTYDRVLDGICYYKILKSILKSYKYRNELSSFSPEKFFNIRAS